MRSGLTVQIAGAVVFLVAIPSSADTLQQQATELLDDTTPIIIGHSSSLSGAQHLEIEVFPFPGVDAGDPLVDIGSLTKFVTAVTVLQMVDTGAFSLDTRISELLANVPADKEGITLHHLLTHSAGIIESTGDDEETIDRDAFLSRVMAAPLLHPIGRRYHYSNAGYSLLAAIIEIHSGVTFETYLNDNILLPNDLPPIGYQAVYEEHASLRTSRGFATAFRRLTIADASWGGGTPGWNLVGNGGAVATAEGFLRFWNAFHSGNIVSERLVQAALTPHVDEGDGDTFYGYGLVVEPSREHGTMYWHDGGNEHFSAEWRHLSASDTTLFTAGLGNDAFTAMERLMNAVR